jgi:hypothetical protein
LSASSICPPPKVGFGEEPTSSWTGVFAEQEAARTANVTGSNYVIDGALVKTM